MRRWAPALLALMVCACSNAPVRIESHALGGQHLADAGTLHRSRRRQRTRRLPGRAGSTPRGYDTIAAYGPTPAARQLMRALEKEYGLREVNAWPIEPLHMHCAVLEIADGADRAAVLAALARDPRIKLAQPLQTFATRSEDYNDPYVGLAKRIQANGRRRRASVVAGRRCQGGHHRHGWRTPGTRICAAAS
jgi:hypothetical protein